MMSERIYLNNDWKFAEQFEASMTEAAYDDSTMQNVRLPHTCRETPLHYFDEHCYQMISGYRRVIEAEKAWENITVDTQLLRWISAEYSAMEKKISLS